MRFAALLGLLLAACHGGGSPPSYRPIGSELLQNTAFTEWKKPGPCIGNANLDSLHEVSGDGDCAKHWVTKWSPSSLPSTVVATQVADGMRYDMKPTQPVSYYARQYIGDANWFYGKKIRLTATFNCSPTVTRVWYYLHFRWNKDREDAPGPTTISGSGSVTEGKLTADVLMPPGNPGNALDASAGFVPSLNMDAATPSWCVIHKMSAIEIP